MRPAVPLYWRATPADFVPFFTKPVSSTISTASRSAKGSTTYARHSSHAAASSHCTCESTRCVRHGRASPRCSASCQPFLRSTALSRPSRYSPACRRGSERTNSSPKRACNSLSSDRQLGTLASLTRRLAAIQHRSQRCSPQVRKINCSNYRDIGARFIVANSHPDHDTIATFRRTNKAAFEAAFLEVLLLARESGLLKLGTVSIDGTKIDANASKIRSVRYDRAQALRAKLAADIAELTAKAEAADAEDSDPQALPAEIARREALKAKLDAACARLEAEAKAQAGAEMPEYEKKRAAYDAKKGRRGRPPKPPDEIPPPERQTNLTDPDSQLMCKSEAHEYRQAYNAQAVVCAEGSQLILATNMATTPSDQPTFAATILAMEHTIGLPHTVLADAGFASGEAVAKLEARQIEPLVALARTQPHRPYDFRPPPQL